VYQDLKSFSRQNWKVLTATWPSYTSMSRALARAPRKKHTVKGTAVEMPSKHIVDGNGSDSRQGDGPPRRGGAYGSSSYGAEAGVPMIESLRSLHISRSDHKLGGAGINLHPLATIGGASMPFRLPPIPPLSLAEVFSLSSANHLGDLDSAGHAGHNVNTITLMETNKKKEQSQDENKDSRQTSPAGTNTWYVMALHEFDGGRVMFEVDVLGEINRMRERNKANQVDGASSLHTEDGEVCTLDKTGAFLLRAELDRQRLGRNEKQAPTRAEIMDIVTRIVEDKIQQCPKNPAGEEGLIAEANYRKTRKEVVKVLKMLNALISRELMWQKETELWNVRMGSAIKAHEAALVDLYDHFAAALERSAGAGCNIGVYSAEDGSVDTGEAEIVRKLLRNPTAQRQLRAVMRTKMALREVLAAVPGLGLARDRNEPGEGLDCSDPMAQIKRGLPISVKKKPAATKAKNTGVAFAPIPMVRNRVVYDEAGYVLGPTTSSAPNAAASVDEGISQAKANTSNKIIPRRHSANGEHELITTAVDKGFISAADLEANPSVVVVDEGYVLPPPASSSTAGSTARNARNVRRDLSRVKRRHRRRRSAESLAGLDAKADLTEPREGNVDFPDVDVLKDLGLFVEVSKEDPLDEVDSMPRRVSPSADPSSIFVPRRSQISHQEGWLNEFILLEKGDEM
jgi:hypothetical protein